jgi:hypothetical protein
LPGFGERLAAVEQYEEQARANARLVVRQLGPLSGIDFGLNRESVEWVEGFIERQRARPDFDADSVGGLVDTLGSFLGECIAANTGGAWRWSDEQQALGVAFPAGGMAFPFAKVRKLFLHGLEAGESISSFYDVAVDYLAKGKLGG